MFGELCEPRNPSSGFGCFSSLFVVVVITLIIFVRLCYKYPNSDMYYAAVKQQGKITILSSWLMLLAMES